MKTALGLLAICGALWLISVTYTNVVLVRDTEKNIQSPSNIEQAYKITKELIELGAPTFIRPDSITNNPEIIINIAPLNSMQIQEVSDIIIQNSDREIGFLTVLNKVVNNYAY